MKLWLAAVLPPLFVWCFVCLLLWCAPDTLTDRHDRRYRRLAPWLFVSPLVLGELLGWLLGSDR
jgi:hypothetical protein